MAQKLPGDYVENLLDKAVEENGGFFENAAYEGYKLSIETITTEIPGASSGDDEEEAPASRVTVEESERVTFDVTVALKVNESAYHEEESGAEDADAPANE